MSEWFRNDPVLALMYLFAIPATIILVLQTILLLFGVGGEDGDLDSDTGGLGDADSADLPDDVDGEMDGGFDGDTGLRMFTVRGMVAFFSVGGWAGISAIKLGANHLVATIIALVMGIAALYLVALFFKLIPRIQHNGTMRLSNAVGSIGEVYITVPANGEGSGKINVILQSQLSELTAVTYADRALRYGEKVRVTGTIGENTLVVEPVVSAEAKNA
ncbi:MAG: hypothetical protein E7554_00335 [Ruminococcaceae bacterium]|nr:hypothetical protein [Oscillospiraceae bacterium]